MNRFMKYLKVQSIRSIKHYPMILGLTLLLTVSLVLFANMMFKTNDTEGMKKKIRIGLVGDLTETYLDVGIVALKNLDSSQYYVDLIEMNEAEAREKLANGELYGYISIPEGFVESIVWGENKPLTYVAANSPATLGPTMVSEILQIISQLVVQGQNGIYGMIEIAEEFHVSQDVYDQAIIDLNVKYIDTVLDREQFYELDYVGLGDGISFTNYYVCAFFILLLMLWGMTCSSLLIKNDMALQRVLCSRGHWPVGLVLGDYIPFAFIMVVNVALLLGVGAHVLEIKALELSLTLVPVILLISGLQFFLYEITANYISGVFIQLFAVLILSYVSGLFYPIYSLPEVFQKLSALLPTGVAFDYLKGVFHGNVDAQVIRGVWMYVMFFLMASVGIRMYKMRSNKYE